MPRKFEKKPKLVNFEYDGLPLGKQQMDDLLMIVRMLAIDRERALQIVLNEYVDVAIIRIAALKDGYYLGLCIPLDDPEAEYPQILASECLTVEEVETVLRGICGQGGSIEQIPIVQEKLEDVTSQVFRED